jgi:hypothetical protein
MWPFMSHTLSYVPTLVQRRTSQKFCPPLLFRTSIVNLNGIPYRLRVVCTPLCICSLSTYRIIQGLLTRKSEIRDIFVGELRANS